MQYNQRPIDQGFYQPAEWEKHQAVWLAYPSHKEWWLDYLEEAQREFVAFCEAIADIDPSTNIARGEKLNILVPNKEILKEAELRLKHLPVKFYEIPFGDVWLRDTAPIFLKNKVEIATAQFEFNGWGEKYVFPFDDQVAENIANVVNLKKFKLPFILEGGSVEVDGEGTCLTSKQCLLNPNRNFNLSQNQIEQNLKEALGVKKILWLDQGLINDHTDGHIDTMARYVAPGKILCMQATTEDDPNLLIYQKMAKDLKKMTDAKNRPITVGFIPSPGIVKNEDDELMPASYLNFYIANTTVIVPTYGSPMDQAAVAAIALWFPTRKTIGLPAKAILSGGGAFHCISQQQPAKEV